MSALARPTAPIIDTAVELGRSWCAGHLIDGSPALGHALKVARKVDEHLPTASPDLLAAVIVHDAPYFAPPNLDLDATLIAMLSNKVARIVRTIEAEHHALERSATPAVATTDPDTLVASAADKVVSISAIIRRARRSPDPVAFWRPRGAFLARMPYFQAFAAAAFPYLPVGLARDLNSVVLVAANATARHRDES